MSAEAAPYLLKHAAAADQPGGGTVAVLGLGLMGRPMSRRLAEAGVRVRAWNRSGVEPLDVPGWSLHPTAEEACDPGADVDTVITVLPGLAPVVEVVDPLLRPGLTVVVMGTTSPVDLRDWAARALERGAHVVDAPVSGGDVGAATGRLSVMVGGQEDVVARLLPLFDVLGAVVRHLGPVGSGQVAKACNQAVVATTLAVLGEAVVLAERSGLDVEALLDVLGSGLAGSRALEVKRDKLAHRDFTPGGLSVNQHHDLGFVLATAREVGVATPVTALVDQLFGAMRWTGRGAEDHSGVLQVVEDLSGVGRR
ncbi:NAD(P)-dependent oxidoreductase [Pseudokineococcus sp. 1T1Z-3]|uniref:NAD(P)-dependent oxidoreductase n=1 Tax=Pseudokineococcus sp. 1T1Z-3 TaxID=3132745 RepID=UPI0030964215